MAQKIERANEKNATRQEKAEGKHASEMLAAVIKPLMLRRTKDEVFGVSAQKSTSETKGRNDETDYCSCINYVSRHLCPIVFHFEMYSSSRIGE